MERSQLGKGDVASFDFDEAISLGFESFRKMMEKSENITAAMNARQTHVMVIAVPRVICVRPISSMASCSARPGFADLAEAALVVACGSVFKR